MKVTSINQLGEARNVAFDSFTFAGGEEHIRFSPEDFNNARSVQIQARLNQSSALMQLLMAKDALDRMLDKSVTIELCIPYFPYARQDRVCVEGEALGAAVMAKFINDMCFDNVIIWDAHSDVTPALLNNVTNVSQLDIVKRSQAITHGLTSGEITLVSPDAGASKKTLNIAETFDGIPDVITAQKKRNLKTGRIIKTEVTGDVAGKDLLIVDDICDGGTTFVEVAKVLKTKGAKSVSLFVTHGIFSKGLSVFDGLIDVIYTSDAFKTKEDYEAIYPNPIISTKTKLIVITQ